MAGSLNKVTLIGNLGRDPEVRHTQDGAKIVNLSVATTESWKDKVTNERRDRTEWHRVVIFNERLADVSEQYLRKGSKVYLEGQLQTRKWTDQEGVEKYTTEVVLQRFRGELLMMDSRGDNSGAGDSFGSSNVAQFPASNAPAQAPAFSPAPAAAAAGASAAGSQFDDLNDEVPF